MKANGFKPIVYMFLVIVIGVAFVNVYGNSINPVTTIQLSTNDSTVISSARLVGNQIDNNTNFTLDYAQSVTGRTPISNFVLKNVTGSTISLAGNYTVNLTSGILVLTNSTYWVSGGGSKSNQTFADYNYKSANYVEDSGTRNVFDLIIFFSSLGLLLCVLGYLNWDYLKEWFDL